MGNPPPLGPWRRKMEPILEPAYWARRLREAKSRELHHAIFKCPLEQWMNIANKHREILKKHIGIYDSILDVGCGWGRLLDLTPVPWYGAYLGIDLSPDFIEMARDKDPSRIFMVGDVRTAPLAAPTPFPFIYDWAVMISIRPMIKRNLGEDSWDEIETNVRCYAKRLLYLEYDEMDEGSVE